MHPDDRHVAVIADGVSGVFAERAEGGVDSIDVSDGGDEVLDASLVVVDGCSCRGYDDGRRAGPGDGGEHGVEPVEGILRFGAGNDEGFLRLAAEGDATAQHSDDEQQPHPEDAPGTPICEAAEPVEESCHW